MKILKTCVIYILEYIAGSIIFNLVYSFVQTMYMRSKGVDGLYFIDVLRENFASAIIIYTIIYIGACALEYAYNKRIAKMLNEKLKKGERNEK